MPRLRARGDEDMGEVLADAALEREGLAPRWSPDVVGSVSKVDVVVQPRRAARAAARARDRRRPAAAAAGEARRSRRPASVSGVSRRNSVGRKPLDRAAHDAVRCPGSRPRPRPARASSLERPVGGEGVGDVAEGVLAAGRAGNRRTRRCASATTYWPSWLRGVSRRVWITLRARRRRSGRWSRGNAIRMAQCRLQPRSSAQALTADIAAVMAAPSRLLSAMNSLMNSCSPLWKISSMRLFCSRVRMARACRCAGPCRP